MSQLEKLENIYPNVYAQELNNIDQNKIDLSIYSEEELTNLLKEIEEELLLFKINAIRRERLRQEFREEKSKLQEKLKLEEKKLRKQINYSDSELSDSEEMPKKKRGRPSKKK